MPSPFPGMDPYLEQPTFWSSFHSRLIVAIADTLAPQLRPHYFVEVETRTYDDTPDGELLVGIPDAVVLASVTQPNLQPSETALTPATSEPYQPQTVTLPMPVEIQERYLEVREIGSNKDCNLGAGYDAALNCAKPLIMERLTQPSTDIQTLLLKLLDGEPLGPRVELTAERLTQLKTIFKETLTSEDWQAIAQTAAEQVHHQVMDLMVA